MTPSKRRKTWNSLSEALRQRIAESELAFIEMERRTGGVVKRQTIMWFLRGERKNMRLDKADALLRLFDLKVVETKQPAKRRTKKGR